MGWKDVWFRMNQPEDKSSKHELMRIRNVRSVDLELLQSIVHEHQFTVSMEATAQEAAGNCILSWSVLLSAAKGDKYRLDWIAFLYNRYRVKRQSDANHLFWILDDETLHPVEENQPQEDFLKNWRPIDLKALINSAPATQVQIGPLVKSRGMMPLAWHDPEYMTHKFAF